MPNYKVTVTETRIGRQEFIVTGRNPEAASRRALELALHVDFPDDDFRRKASKPVRVSKPFRHLRKESLAKHP